MKVFVTGIDTDSGKTVASAILCDAYKADYWKPVQAGLEETDSDFIRSYVFEDIVIHPEAYALKRPMSPNLSAQMEGTEIDTNKFVLPEAENLIVEGAGGLMVPVCDDFMVADLISQLGLPVVLVIRMNLGCINHSLLTINELKRREIPIHGIVLNEGNAPESESFLLSSIDVPVILRIRKEHFWSRDILQRYALEVVKND